MLGTFLLDKVSAESRGVRLEVRSTEDVRNMVSLPPSRWQTNSLSRELHFFIADNLLVPTHNYESLRAFYNKQYSRQTLLWRTVIDAALNSILRDVMTTLYALIAIKPVVDPSINAR